MHLHSIPVTKLHFEPRLQYRHRHIDTAHQHNELVLRNTCATLTWQKKVLSDIVSNSIWVENRSVYDWYLSILSNLTWAMLFQVAVSLSWALDSRGTCMVITHQILLFNTISRLICNYPSDPVVQYHFPFNLTSIPICIQPPAGTLQWHWFMSLVTSSTG